MLRRAWVVVVPVILLAGCGDELLPMSRGEVQVFVAEELKDLDLGMVVESVSCDDGLGALKGDTTECAVHLDSGYTTLTVTVVDDGHGSLEPSLGSYFELPR